jgi:hypothetical protein
MPFTLPATFPQECSEVFRRLCAYAFLYEARPTEQESHWSKSLTRPSPEIEPVVVPNDLPISELEASATVEW